MRFPRFAERSHLVARPPLFAVGATVLVLILIAMVIVVPVISVGDTAPNPFVEFWWVRVAPRSYAMHRLTTVDAFAVLDSTYYCVSPGEPYQAWETVLATPNAEDRLIQIFREGSAAGRVFALTGLAAQDSPQLTSLLQASTADTATVRFMDDQSVAPRRVPLAQLATEANVRAWAAHLRAMTRVKC